MYLKTLTVHKFKFQNIKLTCFVMFKNIVFKSNKLKIKNFAKYLLLFYILHI